MKIKSMILTHGEAHLVPHVIGLEACLVNFTFTDQMRFAFLNSLTESNPGVPVIMNSSRVQLLEEVSLVIKSKCSSLEDFVDISCIEEEISWNLQLLVAKNRDSWFKEAKSATQSKLAHLPKEWFDLFACVPREKHLRVLSVLLSKSAGRSKGAHSCWMTDQIELILQMEDTQGGNAA